MSIRIRSVRAALALGVAFSSFVASAQQADGVGAMYRCPGNDYKNTISAKEAEKLGCRKVEGAPVTVIQTTRPRSVGSAVPSTTAAAASGIRVDPVAQRARDTDARRILEGEL